MIRTFAGKTSHMACAATLAGALTLTTATTAPARADSNGDAIAAAAFLGLVAAAVIATSRSDGAHPGGYPLPPVVVPQSPLPSACRFDIKLGSDRGSWYGRRCLISQYRYWGTLPGVCAERVELPNVRYDVVAYEAGCLWRHGLMADDQGQGGHGHDGRH
ncbi:MAG: hypothetical protein KDK10_03325 [Maritimibacter sp.]|nr:hypothetical protein [Maritimibacter sp.]MCB1354952.1 hypothetical protein [Maritimibacter sp.]